MNKKYLSVILFGALMLGTTGTFTSCKDYDDDINNLQSQVDGIKTTLAELQKAIENGKYVTSIVAEGNGLKITMNDGTSNVIENVINGETPKPGDVVTFDAETGEILINGEKTGYYASKDASTATFKAPYVNEEGILVLINEEGEEVVTGIRVAPVTAVENADGSYTLTIIAADGSKQEIKIPSAASRISDLIVNQGRSFNFWLYTYEFEYKGTGKPDRNKWAGPRALPKDGYIVAAQNAIPLQINPSDVEATGLEFGLVDSWNRYATGLTLTASENIDLLAVTKADFGNGRYDLNMADEYFEKETDKDKFLAQFDYDYAPTEATKLYAVATGSVRSQYHVAIKEADQGVTLNQIEVTPDFRTVVRQDVGDNTATITVTLNTWYYVTAKNLAAMYDMYLSADKDMVTLFGIEFVNEEDTHAFRITKTPDNITKDHLFDLNVETVDKAGQYQKTIFHVGQSTIINDGVTYDAVSHEIKDKAATENYFSISLDKMKEALGTDGLALWNTNAKKIVFSVLNTNGQELGNFNGIAPVFVEKNEKEAAAVAAYKNANFIQFRIDNATASASDLEIGKTYYAYIAFYTEKNEPLNSIIIPFTLTLPAIDTLFQLDKNFVVDGVAACYMYKADSKNNSATFDLNRVFAKKVNGFTITLDNKTNVVNDKKSSNLAIVGQDGNATFGTFGKNTYVTLTGDQDETTGLHLGYGKDLIMDVTGKYAGWSYPAGKDTYTFKAKIMSPIYEGNVTPKEGTSVSIAATDLDGYKLGNNDIIGNTYNKSVTYKVLPDKYVDGATNAWTREEIAKVTGKSSNTRVFNVDNDGVAYPVTKTADGKSYVEGYLLLDAQNIPSTVTTESIEVTVEDMWGYKKTSKIDIKITVNE